MPRPSYIPAKCPNTIVNGSTSDGVTNTTCVDGGRGGSRWIGYRIAPSCGYCNTACAYNAVTVCFVIGVIANLVVILCVLRDKKLRNPTFVAIACLALADVLFLCINLVVRFENVYLITNCIYPGKIIGLPYYILIAVFWFSASSHISLLAILRYVTLAYPLKAHIMLTPRRVIYFSALIWVLGAVIMGTLTILIQLKLIVAGRSQEFIAILWGGVYLMPLIITVILHVIKLRLVKRSTKHSATEITRKGIQRMSKIVVIVIICAAVLPFPRLLGKILRNAGVRIPGDIGTHYNGIARLLFLLNNFINPFVYSFMSKKFRKSIKELFKCCFTLGGTPENSEDTTDTPLASRKISMEMGLERIDQRTNSTNTLSDAGSNGTSPTRKEMFGDTFR